MKTKNLTNAQFLKKVESLSKDKGFTYLDKTGKEWTGEMAIAKHFGMTRAEYRAKLKEAKAEALAKKEAPKSVEPAMNAEELFALDDRVKKLREEGFTYTDENGRMYRGDAAIAHSLGLPTVKLRMLHTLALDFKRKIIMCEDSTNGRFYVELPDGLRLIYDNDGYQGNYDPKLNRVI